MGDKSSISVLLILPPPPYRTKILDTTRARVRQNHKEERKERRRTKNITVQALLSRPSK